MRRARTRVSARPEFGATILRAGMSFKELQAASGVSKSTIFGIQNPSIHKTREGTGIREANAWKLAHAYAAHARIDPDVAFDLLFTREIVQPEHTTEQEL